MNFFFAVPLGPFFNLENWFLIQVSGVAFDSYWSAPNSDGNGENTVYRFGSVGQVKISSIKKRTAKQLKLKNFTHLPYMVHLCAA